jgi:hypothetical protein
MIGQWVYADSVISTAANTSGEDGQMKTICVRLTKQFDHRVRVLAAEQDMTRSELVRQALQEKVARLECGAGELPVCATPGVSQGHDESDLTAMWMDNETITGRSKASEA